MDHSPENSNMFGEATTEILVFFGKQNILESLESRPLGVATTMMPTIPHLVATLCRNKMIQAAIKNANPHYQLRVPFKIKVTLYIPGCIDGNGGLVYCIHYLTVHMGSVCGGNALDI